ncbi:helix-turn-helix transcriptional regulator [Sneathiella sp.]|jgi:predicted DNA-binding transcriptional regulator AlpA|uniref:helix-turn-helix transcriptional regulator n=1 Tax=Sneathiella sp. TaxID=1964365 RepID=UPI0039E26E16
MQDMNTNNTPSQDRLMTEKEAAAFMGYTMRALQNWRLRGGGPNYVKVSSRSIRYRFRDINDWIEARIINNTSQMTGA